MLPTRDATYPGKAPIPDTLCLLAESINKRRGSQSAVTLHCVTALLSGRVTKIRRTCLAVRVRFSFPLPWHGCVNCPFEQPAAEILLFALNRRCRAGGRRGDPAKRATGALAPTTKLRISSRLFSSLGRWFFADFFFDFASPFAGKPRPQHTIKQIREKQDGWHPFIIQSGEDEN